MTENSVVRRKQVLDRYWKIFGNDPFPMKLLKKAETTMNKCGMWNSIRRLSL